MNEARIKKATEIIIWGLYDEKFPMEDYRTADYIGGREKRAWSYYLNNAPFHHKVDTMVASIFHN